MSAGLSFIKFNHAVYDTERFSIRSTTFLYNTEMSGPHYDQDINVFTHKFYRTPIIEAYTDFINTSLHDNYRRAEPILIT